MVSLKKTSQGGFLQTFIIIATILALVTAGLVYFVKDRGETARRNQAIALADQITASDDAAKADNKGQESESGATTSEGSPSSADESSNGTVDTSKDSATQGAVPAEDLPTTGPAEDIIISITGLGLLAGSGMYYIESRRKLNRSL